MKSVVDELIRLARIIDSSSYVQKGTLATLRDDGSRWKVTNVYVMKVGKQRTMIEVRSPDFGTSTIELPDFLKDFET